MTPTFEQHHGDHKLDEIIHLLHKLNRKIERLLGSQDFSKEDKLVKDMTQKVKDATLRVQPRVPPSTTSPKKN
jgi:hypothetical protein